jgi:hypothetical protein
VAATSSRAASRLAGKGPDAGIDQRSSATIHVGCDAHITGHRRGVADHGDGLLELGVAPPGDEHCPSALTITKLRIGQYRKT